MNQYVSESRALDIPIALVNRHRELTSKGEFVVTVWSAAAVGLGRLHHAQDRARCIGLQKSVYTRFTEGPEAADIKCARRFLEEWNIGALSKLKSWVQQHTRHRLLSNSFGRIWSPL
jgi:hypothetical protein